MDQRQAGFADKGEIAARYKVSLRTINQWMAKRIIPFIRVSHKLVRFDIEKCDMALQLYEVKCLMDSAAGKKLRITPPKAGSGGLNR